MTLREFYAAAVGSALGLWGVAAIIGNVLDWRIRRRWRRTVVSPPPAIDLTTTNLQPQTRERRRTWIN